MVLYVDSKNKKKGETKIKITKRKQKEEKKKKIIRKENDAINDTRSGRCEGVTY